VAVIPMTATQKNATLALFIPLNLLFKYIHMRSFAVDLVLLEG
jgi:hypothetical protein